MKVTWYMTSAWTDRHSPSPAVIFSKLLDAIQNHHSFASELLNFDPYYAHLKPIQENLERPYANVYEPAFRGKPRRLTVESAANTWSTRITSRQSVDQCAVDWKVKTSFILYIIRIIHRYIYIYIYYTTFWNASSSCPRTVSRSLP